MKRFVSHYLKILVYSNVFIALSAGAFSIGWTNTNNILNWKDYGFFAFFATLSIYNLDKLWKIRWVKHPTAWLIWIQDNSTKMWVLTSLSALFGLHYLFQIMHFNSFIGISILLLGAICATFYSFPIKQIRLRTIPGTKAFLIALVWTFILGVFPLINANTFSTEVLYSFLFLFPFFLALTIPFDIRDADIDEIYLKTIPQVIGNNRAQLLGLLLITISIFFAFFIFKSRLLILIPVYSLFSWLIFRTNRLSPWWHFALIDMCIFLLGLALYFSAKY
jgi:hypothetical protein